jgi:drug/metabolite transporter (DMT)-like permease
VIARSGGRAALRSSRPGLQALRAGVGFAAATGFFYAFAHMPLGEVIAIGFSAPLFVTALSMPLLGERVGLHRWSAVVTGFVGVLIMVQPGKGMIDPWAGAALLGALGYALSIILIRRLSVTDPQSATVFWFFLLSAAASGITLPWLWVTPSLGDLALLITIGVLSGIGQIAFIRAFSLAPPVIVAPFDYTSMLLATAIGYLVWGEAPAPSLLLGAAVVIASGLYIIYREALVPDQGE